MANFKTNKTIGICSFCGRQGKDLCAISYPVTPEKPASLNTKRILVCGGCGTLINRVTVDRQDWMRNRHHEKLWEVVTEEKAAKRRKERQLKLKRGKPVKSGKVRRSSN